MQQCRKKLLGSNTDVSVLLTDAQAPPTREEYVKGMKQNVNNQRSSDAAVKGAQIKLDRKECEGGMEQRRNYAATKDVLINLIQEECVGDMGRRRRGSFAVVKDAQIKLDGKEECASGTGNRKRHGAKKGNAPRKPKVVQSTKREAVQFDCTVLPLKIICDMSHL
eukprot:scaffold3535_cov94-Skeletonema_dohrnii-CCMP3373.AAC.3